MSCDFFFVVVVNNEPGNFVQKLLLQISLLDLTINDAKWWYNESFFIFIFYFFRVHLL